MALVEGEARSATVRAKTDVKLWRLPKEYFEKLVREDVEFAARIYRPLTMILSRRLRETTERLAIANQVIRLVSGKPNKQE
jgi:CRP-like cAMP-binding protein